MDNGPEYLRTKTAAQGIREMDIRFLYAGLFMPSFTGKTKQSRLTWFISTAPTTACFPHRLVKADFLIKGGNHVMVMDSATEISAFIRQLLA